MRFGPPDDDTPAPSGRTVLEGVADPSTQALFPYGASSPPERRTWLSLMNPDPARDAIVLVNVSAPNADVVVPGEIVIPPRGDGARGPPPTCRNAVRSAQRSRSWATCPSWRPAMPCAMSTARQRSMRTWQWQQVPIGSCSGGQTADGYAALDLFNFGGEPATVTVEPLAGPDGQSVDAPDDWQALTIDANAQRGLPLSDVARVPHVPVRVRSDVPVVAGMRSASAEGVPDGFRTLAGFTPATWDGLPTRPRLQYAPGLDSEPLPEPTSSP